MRRALLGMVVLVCAAGRASAASLPAPILLDACNDTIGWSAHPADGVDLRLSSDAGVHGRALRMDFHFTGGGYAVAHKAFDLDLPDNYAFTFQLRGECPVNHLEFKLIDRSGENVWWSVRRDMTFPKTWETFTVRRRQIQFAWGPLGGGEIPHVAAIEIVVTAGTGGTGTVWIDDLTLRTLPPPDAVPPKPVIRASSSSPGFAAARIADGDSRTAWAPKAGDRAPWVKLDFTQPREFGGLVIDWLPERGAPDYAVETSEDGAAWRTVRTVRDGNGGRDYIYLPESESRYVMVRIGRGGAGDGRAPGGAPAGAVAAGPAIAALTVEPLEWSATRQKFFEAVAGDAPAGAYPRGMSGQQVFWTVVGADRDTREGLLSEDGAFETGPGGFSIEPLLRVNGRLYTWHDVQAAQSLMDGDLPIPAVTWAAAGLTTSVTAFTTGAPEASAAVLRYIVRAGGPAAPNPDAGGASGSGAPSAAPDVPGTLCLALRPFQVNPPSQSLNLAGGTAPIRSIERRGPTITVNDVNLVALAPPDSFGAATFDEGDVVAGYLEAGHLPARQAVVDSFAAASGVLTYDFDLAAGDSLVVDLLVPLHPTAPAPPEGGAATLRIWAGHKLRVCRDSWAAKLGTVSISLPPSGAAALESMKSQLGWILVNRAGPAIQPGTRSYARSWIRDGSLTSTALLRLGHPEDVKAFIEWFAPYQYPSGKIPCVVDTRGADPVPEHDSSGEFIYLVAEYFRYTGDSALTDRMWPRVRAAAAYLDSLRHERLTDEYLEPDRFEFHGILPPSISHEGYSAKPMHSYWDDFFALRGFKDAVFLAGALGHPEDQARLTAIRDAFAGDLAASVKMAMEKHDIRYVPGCADLGDFDATSTTIALAPTGAADILPAAAIDSTFEGYYRFFRARENGAPWDAYTPYEIRNLGAFVRLGWRDRAQELLRFFLEGQRPSGWRQWPEVVWHRTREPHFLGDLPHTWVGSDYVRSFLDMLAYERESDSTLVIGAGVPPAWVDEEPGVVVRGLPTMYGPLSYTMKRRGDRIETRLDAGLRLPPGGIVVRAPGTPPGAAVTVNGHPARAGREGEIVVRAVPLVVSERRGGSGK